MVHYSPASNVLIALNNLLIQQNTSMPIVTDYKSNNRVNSVGDLLEYYVKDAFCGKSSHLELTDDKLEEYQKKFSYLGNTNNPPDFIVKHGVAVEVKKISGRSTSGIALNSSFPKDILHNDDIKIKQSCRECEDEYGGWTNKEMVYAIGNVEDNKLHSLWLIYGDCYCADKSTYERIADTIKDGVSSIPDIDFGETKELGRVNRVDPLGITYLRIRGMWGIDHPSDVFRSLIHSSSDKTDIYVLMKKETYNEIENKPDLSPYIDNNTLECKEIKIPDPNNPAKNLDAIMYTATF